MRPLTPCHLLHTFLSGGFRGTVGVALALSLNSTVKKYSNVASLVMDGTTTNAEMINQADKLFVVVGAISLMTLLINGMTSSPLLSAV